MFRPSLRAWSLWAGKLALSCCLLWLALRKVPLASLREALGRADPFWCALSVGVALVGVALFETLRLRAAGLLLTETQPRFLPWLGLFFESRAFLYLLPSGLGQEGYLWWKLRKRGWNHSSCVFLVLVVRITGLAFWVLAMAWALRAPAFLAASRNLLPGPLAYPLAWALLGAALLLASWALSSILVRLGRLQKPGTSWAPWAGLLPATGGNLLTCALAFHLAARAFGLSFSLGQAAGTLTLIFLGMVLPISLAGLGLQEALLLMVGRGLGMAAGPLLGLSCLLHLQRLVPALVGLLVMLARPSGTPRPLPRPDPPAPGSFPATGADVRVDP